MKQTCLHILVWMFVLILADASVAEPKKVAVLVGINKYDKPGFPALQFAERDVEQLAIELKKLGFTVTVLKGSGTEASAASRDNILAQLKRAVKPLTQEDLILVMFSGHGQELMVAGADGKARPDNFYCPVEAVNRDAESQVSLSHVIDDILAPNVGRKLLLVDACRDTPQDPSRGSKGVQGRITTLPEDTAVFFSCRAGQRSFERPELQHGLFTYCVLEALRGKAARDSQIAWIDVVAHVSQRMGSPEIVKFVPDGTRQTPIPAGGVEQTILGSILVAAETLEGTKGGELREFNKALDLKMVWCPPTSAPFVMGSPASEKGRSSYEDQVQVTLSSGFWLGQTEVTQAQWKSVMGTEPWKGESYVKEGAKYAASYVSLDDAVSFCQKLTEQERKAGRLPVGWMYTLPTEAQWEYACRAGTQTEFSFGDNESELGQYAWYEKNAFYVDERFAHAVGLKNANAWGLHDMHGNVMEWCSDWYGEKLPGGRNPMGVSSGVFRVFRVYRGGSWFNAASYCRSADRSWSSPDYRNNDLGFRMVAVPSSQ